MIFTITFKDPDGVSNDIDDAVKERLKKLEGEPETVLEAAREAYSEELRNFTSEWLSYGEYVTIEFDTEKGTATVVPA